MDNFLHLPTFDDLSIDDTISALDRCIKYSRSKIGLQRLVHVQMISDVALTVGYEITRNDLLPILEDCIGDSESPVRQHCAGQLSKIAKHCILWSSQLKDRDENSDNKNDIDSSSESYNLILSDILPIVALLLEDDKAEVRRAASNSLLEISKLLNYDDLGPNVLTIVLALAHDDEKEEMRMTASELLNQLSECLGEDLCKQFVIPEVVSLAEDPVFRVRKSTALNFQNVCKVGGEHELFERLMPAYVRLSKDEMYRVRRACAESLADVSRHVSDDIRIGVLAEIFLRLAQDPSKLVKQSILQQSGVFISTLPPRAITDVILQQYCSMASDATGDINVDMELKQHCAYTFPGVLKTIGRHRWLGPIDDYEEEEVEDKDNDGHSETSASDAGGSVADSVSDVAESEASGFKERRDSATTIGTAAPTGSIMKETYFTLLASRSVAVKETLALSLHEIAKILSSDEDDCKATTVSPSSGSSRKSRRKQQNIVEQELATVFEELIQDVEVVQIGVIKHLACFLRLLSLPCRTSYLPILPDILHSTNPFNWRLRQSLAVQLSELVVLPKPDGLVLPLFPLVMALLQDPVASVRKESYAGTATMVRILHNNLPEFTANSNDRDSESKKAQDELTNVLSTLNRLSTGQNCQQRQLWLDLCAELLKEVSWNLFEAEFVEGIVKLSKDPVVSVRLMVSRLLTGWEKYIDGDDSELSEVDAAADTDAADQQYSETETTTPETMKELVKDAESKTNTPTTEAKINKTKTKNMEPEELRKLVDASPWGPLLARADIKEVIRFLSKDDMDIYIDMIKLAPLYPDVDFGIKSCRGLKKAPGLLSDEEENGSNTHVIDEPIVVSEGDESTHELSNSHLDNTIDTDRTGDTEVTELTTNTDTTEVAEIEMLTSEPLNTSIVSPLKDEIKDQNKDDDEDTLTEYGSDIISVSNDFDNMEMDSNRTTKGIVKKEIDRVKEDEIQNLENTRQIKVNEDENRYKEDKDQKEGSDTIFAFTETKDTTNGTSTDITEADSLSDEAMKNDSIAASLMNGDKVKL